MKPKANGEKMDESVKVGEEIDQQRVETPIAIVTSDDVSVSVVPTVSQQVAAEEANRKPAWTGHYILSVLTTLCCFGPCSVIGLVHFLAAKTEYNKGNVRDAMKRKRQARVWSWVAITIGVIATVAVLTCGAMWVRDNTRQASEGEVERFAGIKDAMRKEIEAVLAGSGSPQALQGKSQDKEKDEVSTTKKPKTGKRKGRKGKGRKGSKKRGRKYQRQFATFPFTSTTFMPRFRPRARAPMNYYYYFYNNQESTTTDTPTWMNPSSTSWEPSTTWSPKESTTGRESTWEPTESSTSDDKSTWEPEENATTDTLSTWEPAGSTTGFGEGTSQEMMQSTDAESGSGWENFVKDSTTWSASTTEGIISEFTTPMQDSEQDEGTTTDTVVELSTSDKFLAQEEELPSTTPFMEMLETTPEVFESFPENVTDSTSSSSSTTTANLITANETNSSTSSSSSSSTTTTGLPAANETSSSTSSSSSSSTTTTGLPAANETSSSTSSSSSSSTTTPQTQRPTEFTPSTSGSGDGDKLTTTRDVVIPAEPPQAP